MSMFTANDVFNEAEAMTLARKPRTAEMLHELARRLRQDAEEGRRDPLTDPLSGDRATAACAEFMFADETNVYVTSSKAVWRAWTAREGITFARRGEFTK